MADSKCCFGCSDVRRGSWIISLFNMLICIILTINALWQYNNTEYPMTRDVHRKGYYDSDVVATTHHSQIGMESDFTLFTRLFIIFLFFYVNLNLKKATYMHNAQSINHWLITNSIFFIFFVIYVGFTTIKNSKPDIVPIGIPISIVTVYQIYVVKCFYEDELKFLANSERNITQSTVHGPPYVTITTQQTVQNSAYPVQPGPYVIQQVHQPTQAQATYPQQTYQYPHPQQQPQSSVVLPPSDLHTPQEYCNPPPYSPNCNMSEGFAIKK